MPPWPGKRTKDTLSSSRSQTPVPSRSATPQPQQQYGGPLAVDKKGHLTVRVLEGRKLALPPNVGIPLAIEEAVKTGHHRRASSQSVQAPRECWWLPYVLLEYENSALILNANGGQLAAPMWTSLSTFDVSRQSDIVLSVYLRTSRPPATSEDAQIAIGNDILVARLEVTPKLDPLNPTDQWYSANQGAGEFHLHISFRSTQNEELRVESFDLLALIGKGSFGKVMQVRKKDTGRIYAMKSIRKANIASRPGEITHILAERTVLGHVRSPFIVPLKFSFQTTDKLYLVMSFINGGELFHHLQREGRFDQTRSRFYAAELLCALEHLHSLDVVYRDLKPENILLSYTGHIALCDFGLCKLNMSSGSKTDTFCGTPEYIAPELLLAQGYTRSVDWWTLGTLLFEFLTGLPPFYDQDVNKMYQRILHDTLRFPPEVHSEARRIITALLQKDPAVRLGTNGADEIKQMPFFAKIDWRRLLAMKITPPFKPSVSGLIDVSNFDPEFTSEPPADSVVEDSNISQTIQEQFTGFTYNPTNEALNNGGAQYGSVMV